MQGMKTARRFVGLIIAILFLAFQPEIAPVSYTEGMISAESYIQKDGIVEGKFSLLAPVEKGFVQGGCYIEDGLYIFCYCSGKSDDLTLRCYDSKTGEYVWNITINGGAHGNAICFRPDDRKLYIADCFSYDSRDVLKNTISVVDYDNIEAGVIDVITSPARGGIYSIAYDRETDTFYSTNYRGSKEGNANALFSYNGIFEEEREVVCLDDFAARFFPVHSSQGVQCVVDGIAYIPYYSPTPILAGYDIFTGTLLFAEIIPDTIDGRKTGELEAVMYNDEDGTLTILTSTSLLQYDESVTSAQRVFNAASRYIEYNYLQ